MKGVELQYLQSYMDEFMWRYFSNFIFFYIPLGFFQ